MAGLSGIGDLMLTCLGDASRNKAVGIAFGRGQKIEDILNERARSLQGVAEGVATAPAAERLAKKLGVAAPMISTCAACLRGELDAKGALRRCMTLPIKPDEPLRKSGGKRRNGRGKKRLRRRSFSHGWYNGDEGSGNGQPDFLTKTTPNGA